jgi:hypothetical protein
MEHDIIDLTADVPVINLNMKPSVNFGGGLELLMNDKQRRGMNDASKSMVSEIDLGDLDSLEQELNGLTTEINLGSGSGSGSGAASVTRDNYMSSSAAASAPFMKLNRERDDASVGSIVSINDVSMGNSNRFFNSNKPTAENSNNNKTWDGFDKFNNIPLNPDKVVSEKPKLTPEETLLEKFKVLRKLEEIERKGAILTKRYTMESSLLEMQGEYEMIINEKERSNSVKFQGRMLMAAVTGLEFLNNRFDPFDVKLDGWAEQLNENITEYDEIFGELHEKYKSKAKMAPELKLLFQLGGSAIMVHMTNTMFKSAMPGMDDIMRQNPELMQQFTQAAVNSMGETNPGFSGFMNNFMPGAGGSGQQRPPPPMATQPQKGNVANYPPPGRPDMSRARQQQQQDDGISIVEQFGQMGPEVVEKSSMRRPEMKGPSDISDILSGLKTKTVNLQSTPQTQAQKQQSQAQQSQAQQSQQPKTQQAQQAQQSQAQQSQAQQSQQQKSKAPPAVPQPAYKTNSSSSSAPKRKQKSDKNTISLDI